MHFSIILDYFCGNRNSVLAIDKMLPPTELRFAPPILGSRDGSLSFAAAAGSSSTTAPSFSVLMNKSRFMPKQLPKFRLSCQVGKKISKTRWLKSEHGGIIPDALVPEYFVVGSWGELENDVSLWKLSVPEAKGEEPANADLQLLERHPISGNVQDMATLSNTCFALTTSLGAVSMYKFSGAQPNKIELVSSKELHHTLRSRRPCPATGIAIQEKLIVTVGEDGSIFELSADNFNIIQSFQAVDELSLCCVEYTGSHVIATGNNGGQVKIFDLQSGERKPIQTLNHLEDLSSAISIAPHPTQSHIVLVGYASGGTDLWDLRGSSSEPIANLQQQEGGVTEIFFHPLYPDNFYTCSQTGEVIHYFTAENITQSYLVQNNDYDTDLNLEFLKCGLSAKTIYSSPFPINSMHLSRNNRLICGGDSGIMFCTEKV